MEKLSSDVISAKVDSLLTLVGVSWRSQSYYSIYMQAASSDMYRQVIQDRLEQLWSSVSREVGGISLVILSVFPGN